MAEKRRVLCIKDDLEMIDLIKVILERKGFEVMGAIGGRKGFDAGKTSP